METFWLSRFHGLAILTLGQKFKIAAHQLFATCWAGKKTNQSYKGGKNISFEKSRDYTVRERTYKKIIENSTENSNFYLKFCHYDYDQFGKLFSVFQ